MDPGGGSDAPAGRVADLPGGAPAALALLSDGRRLRARRLPTASRLLWDAPDRVARREREDRRGGVPAAARRDDPAAALERLRDRGPHRDPAARGRHDDPRGHRTSRVGEALPGRTDLESAETPERLS